MGCSCAKHEPESETTARTLWYSSRPAWDERHSVFVADALPVEWKELLDDAGVRTFDLEDPTFAAEIAELIVSVGWVGLPPDAHQRGLRG